MRICIDGIPLLLRSAGVKNYLYHWIAALQKASSGDEIGVFPFFREIGELDHERSVAGTVSTVAGLALLHLANYSGLPVLDAIGKKFDVFHASQQLRRPPRKTKLTATIHDMTCWLMPEMHSAANVKAAKAFARDVMTKADGLIAVSEHSRQDAIRILGIKPERVRVIHSGVPPAFFAATRESARAVCAKYGLSKDYVLFIGTIEPRKNLTALLDAWEQLAPSIREEFGLAVAGPIGWADHQTIARIQSGTGGWRYLGYIPESDLPGLTAGATALAYPSLYEGFGFPVAQAMAAGVPVITSNVSSLPEVVGDAALLVDPRSVSELRGALDRLLSDRNLQSRLSESGRRRAQRYRWEACAEASLGFFRSLS